MATDGLSTYAIRTLDELPSTRNGLLEEYDAMRIAIRSFARSARNVSPDARQQEAIRILNSVEAHCANVNSFNSNIERAFEREGTPTRNGDKYKHPWEPGGLSVTAPQFRIPLIDLNDPDGRVLRSATCWDPTLYMLAEAAAEAADIREHLSDIAVKLAEIPEAITS